MRQREAMVNSFDDAKRARRFSFTLRSMFIATAMAAGAVWLLIRYAGFPGMFFAVTVLCAGYCVLRANKARAAGYMVIFAVAWVALQFFGPYTSLRNRVVWLVGTERLQEWAVEVLDDPPAADEYGMILLGQSALPEDIRSVAGHHNEIILADDHDHISFGHGGGFYHWGLLIGRPGYTPHFPNQYDKIANGIWGYQGG